MSIFVSGKSSFVPPPNGLHNAVCVDVVDLGVVNTNFGPKPQVRISFEIDKLMPPDPRNPAVQKPYVASRWFTKSIGKKANLRKFAEDWRGRQFTPAELEKFDLEKMLNAPAQILIQPSVRADGSTSNGITAIMRVAAGVQPLQPSGFYERVKDRKPQGAPMPHAEVTPGDEVPQEEADGIPF
jgi:hypothetical protein